VTESEKHSGLLRYGIIYSHNFFTLQDQVGLSQVGLLKHFMAFIYGYCKKIQWGVFSWSEPCKCIYICKLTRANPTKKYCR